MMHVPATNFSNSKPVFDSGSTVAENEGLSENNGKTPYMSRLVLSLASSAKIIPMSRATANPSYNLTFHGPSLRCHEASASVKRRIQLTNNATTFIWAGGFLDDTNVVDMAKWTPWLVFAPTQDLLNAVLKPDVVPNTKSSMWMMYLKFTRSCLVSPSMSDDFLPKFQDFPLCTGIVAEYDTKVAFNNISDPVWGSRNYGQLWVLSQGSAYNCMLTDTEYRVGFSYSASEKVQLIDLDYDFRWTENDLCGSYFAVASALANLLTGTLDAYNSAIMSSKTRVADTAHC